MQRFLWSTRLSSISRFCLILFVCSFTLGIFPQFALSQIPIDPVQQYRQIFGDPDAFITEFQSEAKENLNQYIGAGIAIGGFALAVRAMFR